MLLAALLAVTLLSLYAWYITRVAGPDWTAAGVCRGYYARAASATDSAVVDAQTPVTSRGQASVAVRCGTLRTAGKL